MSRRIYRNEILKYLHEKEGYAVHAGIIADELDLSEYQVVSSINNMVATGYANIETISPKVYRIPVAALKEESSTTRMTVTVLKRDPKFLVIIDDEGNLYKALRVEV